MLCSSCRTPSLARNSPLIFLIRKVPLLLVDNNIGHRLHFDHHSSLFAKVLKNVPYVHSFAMNKMTLFCTVAVSAMPPIYGSSVPAAGNISNRSKKKKARQESPEAVLKYKLDMCSKYGDLLEALRLYEEARSNGVQLNQYHYNVLLYLCSSSGSLTGSSSGETGMGLGFRRGFEIFQQMVIDKVAPNEATFTSAARLAAAMEDPDMAFDLVNQMKAFGIPPRLRSYGPALFGFCKKGQAEKAYEVDAHMAESGVLAEEPELSALLKLSADVKNAHRVYEMLHRLRGTVRQVSESTAEIVEGWFKSEDAAAIGIENWDISEVTKGTVKGGGGWHGQGWLGSGKWRVVRTEMDEKGGMDKGG